MRRHCKKRIPITIIIITCGTYLIDLLLYHGAHVELMAMTRMSALSLRAASIQSEVANTCAHMLPSVLNIVIDSCGWISTQEQIYIYVYTCTGIFMFTTKKKSYIYHTHYGTQLLLEARSVT